MNRLFKTIAALAIAVLTITACEQPTPPAIDIAIVDKSALETAISEAEQLHTTHSIGVEPGNVSENASNDFSIAIETAKTVAESDVASQTEVDEAIQTLEFAVSVFNAAIITSVLTELPASPTLESERVISLYTSSKYDDLPWTQETWDDNDITEETVNIEGTDQIFKKQILSGTAAFLIPATDITDKTTLHLSYFTKDATSLEVKVVEFLNGVWTQDSYVEIVHVVNTANGAWVDYEIDCSSIPRTENVRQIIFSGTSGTVYYDNIYFFGNPVDPAIPVITLLGDSPVYIDHGEVYSDAGATAEDDVDGNITAGIVTANPVDTSTPGTYTITYNVTDSDSNAAGEVTRTVIVEGPDNYDPGSEWTLSWSDEFDDGIFGTDTWDRQVWLSPPNGEWEQYTGEASTAYESDGKMVLKATYDGPVHGYGNYTSARVISNPGGGSGNSGSTGKVFKYGKIAARIKLPSGKGIWPAFWMLGDNINETGGTTSWPGCGEIDILETGSKHANDSYYGHATAGQAIHFSNSGNSWEYSAGSMSLDSGQYSDNYHVFEIEWDSTRIIWKIDGAEAHREDITASYLSEFHENFYVIFNIAVGGNYTYEPDSTTGFPKYMYIDWLRHYEKN